MFRKADLVLLTKTDLLPHLPDVSVAAIEDALSRVMPVAAPDPLLGPHRGGRGRLARLAGGSGGLTAVLALESRVRA